MRLRLTEPEKLVLAAFWRAARGRAGEFTTATEAFPDAAATRERRTLVRCAAKGWLEWDGSLFEPAYRVPSASVGRLREPHTMLHSDSPRAAGNQPPPYQRFPADRAVA